MFKLLFKLFVLWRRNDASSIAFKSLFFGALAWLAVGMFTDLRTALMAGGIVAALATFKYYLQYRKEHAALLDMVKGDRQALARLKAKIGDGMGGAMVMELVRAKLEEEREEGEDTAVPLSDEERDANRSASQAQLDKILAIVKSDASMHIEDEEEKLAEIVAEVDQGEYVIEQSDILSALLPEHQISFCLEDYCNDDDHAGLIKEIAGASDNVWPPKACKSHFDEEADKWEVSFVDGGKPIKWRFRQNGDCLSQTFIQQLFAHLEASTDRKILALDSEDVFEGMCLPKGVYEQLSHDDLRQAA